MVPLRECKIPTFTSPSNPPSAFFSPLQATIERLAAIAVVPLMARMKSLFERMGAMQKLQVLIRDAAAYSEFMGRRNTWL
ncbi:hypothetical protein [Synechococcus sp. UW140]|uniref:hypothetical protein n=1 Tax=Synechococcus sp. UW140 TaxID=368503 RepID=UPI0025FEE77C|nr:hypothetical protein [Synechococcus sp. UW140]